MSLVSGNEVTACTEHCQLGEFLSLEVQRFFWSFELLTAWALPGVQAPRRSCLVLSGPCVNQDALLGRAPQGLADRLPGPKAQASCWQAVRCCTMGLAPAPAVPPPCPHLEHSSHTTVSGAGTDFCPTPIHLCPTPTHPLAMAGLRPPTSCCLELLVIYLCGLGLCFSSWIHPRPGGHLHTAVLIRGLGWQHRHKVLHPNRPWGCAAHGPGRPFTPAQPSRIPVLGRGALEDGQGQGDLQIGC